MVTFNLIDYELKIMKVIECAKIMDDNFRKNIQNKSLIHILFNHDSKIKRGIQ